ncbi:hypothetical protein N9M73_06540 [Rhodobacteraceae bacterium]|nr:hypothetical protein [Paracoccaceae bacterium]
MLIIAVALLIAGFFFPPAWLGLLGLGIYFFASSKSRRADAIEVRVKRMVSAGRDYNQFSDIYYEAAHKYALDKGDEYADDQSASALIIVNDVVYNVVFSRAAYGGGTLFSVRPQKDVEREMEQEMRRIMSQEDDDEPIPF